MKKIKINNKNKGEVGSTQTRIKIVTYITILHTINITKGSGKKKISLIDSEKYHVA
jgi:hypothetical protein